MTDLNDFLNQMKTLPNKADLKEDNKPKGKIDEALSGANDMLISIRVQHGIKFYRLVKFCIAVRKATELHAMVHMVAKDSNESFARAAPIMQIAQVSADTEVMAMGARIGGYKRGDPEVKLALEWADKVVEAQQAGISALVSREGLDADDSEEF